MAESVMYEFQDIAESILSEFFEESLNADDVVKLSVRVEVIYFQKWYYWRHIANFEYLCIILMGMGLTFWRAEEEWAYSSIGRESPACISNKFFRTQVRVIRDERLQIALTAPPCKQQQALQELSQLREPDPLSKGLLSVSQLQPLVY